MNRRRLQNSLLALFGVGLAAVIALVARPYLAPEAPVPAGERPCQPASAELLALVRQAVADTRDPCAEFYWQPEPTDEFHVLVRLNNFGLHAPSYTLAKPPGVFRILVVGDSFPQGMQVNREETFPWLLQQQLGGSVEVINLSVDAFGSDRELLLYALLGWQFQPDLVLLSVYPGNDIQNNHIDLEARRYGYRLNRPFFTLGGAIETSPLKGLEADTASAAAALQFHNSVQLDPALYPDSPVFQWLADFQARQTPPPAEDLPPRPAVTSSEPYTLEYPVELGVYLPQDAYWGDAWALTEALLLQFRQVVALSDVPFGLFIIPDRRAVHEADWAATLTQYGDLLPDLQVADPTAPGTRLEQFLSEQGMPALNLTPALREWAAAHPDGRLYYPGDGHFTPEGHAVTVAAIAAWLRAGGLVP